MPENKGLFKFHKLQIFVLSLVFTLFTPVFGFSQDHHATENHPQISETVENTEHKNAEHSKEEGFKPGEMILDHVKDQHGWHIMDIHKHAVAIPLPVILYDNGLHIFSSSKLDH